MDRKPPGEDTDAPALRGQRPDEITAKKAGCARDRGQFPQGQDRLAAARRGSAPSMATETVESASS